MEHPQAVRAGKPSPWTTDVTLRLTDPDGGAAAITISDIVLNKAAAGWQCEWTVANRGWPRLKGVRDSTQHSALHARHPVGRHTQCCSSGKPRPEPTTHITRGAPL